MKPVARVALHEAGHAVMHVWLRLENLHRVSVIPNPEAQSWGRCRVGYMGRCAPGHPGWRLYTRKQILCLMAGGQAELLYSRARRPGIYGDMKLATALAGNLFPENKGLAATCICIQEHRARRLVRSILEKPIREFAAILEQRREIDREKAERVLMRLLGIKDYWDRLEKHLALVQLLSRDERLRPRAGRKHYASQKK